MSGSGAPDLGSLDGSGLRVAVVASTWHRITMEGLLAGAIRALARATIVTPTLARVPGAFELPLMAAALAPSHDAIVALGLVIRGGTPHFDYVCRAATDGLARVQLDHGIPIGFGLLTCDDIDQARARAGLPDSQENKGGEAASAAVAMALALRALGPASRTSGFGSSTAS
ncbi:MAG: 6,7-dimethyl-8-ribityllumazine synthase [Nocardioidaceae bacterium]